MKYSAAMLNGYKLIGGKGQVDHHWRTKDGDRYSSGPTPSPNGITAACVNGAALIGARVEAWSAPHERWMAEFEKKWGIQPQQLNNEGLPWEHIYGMARAAGL